MFEDIDNEIKQFHEEMESMQKTFREKMQVLFAEATKKFFESTPKVQAIVWNQYTPYFNDGEECIFSVNDPIFISSGFDEDDLMNAYEYEDAYEEEDDVDEGVEPLRTIDLTPSKDRYDRYMTLSETSTDSKYWLEQANRVKTAMDEDDGTIEKCVSMSKVIQGDDDFMRALFGDHVTVYITKDKAFTNEYDHE